MDLILKKLLGLLEEEIFLCSEFVLMLQKEKEAVVSSDFDDLDTICKGKETFILKIKILEDQRRHIIEKAADFLEIPYQFLTLTKLSEMVEEPYSSSLKKSNSNLLALSQTIQEINQSNKPVLLHFLKLVRSSMSMLENLMFPDSVYYRSDRMQCKNQCGRVVSGLI